MSIYGHITSDFHVYSASQIGYELLCYLGQKRDSSCLLDSRT